MGAGILPASIVNGKLYFLFGKENKYADTPGFSDFGGGTEKGESYLKTAIREGGEELTGFLGSDDELKKMLSKGTYNIDYAPSDYRMHILPFPYDTALPHYYNNNQKFLQKRLDPEVIKKSKIFEKAEIHWICVDDLAKMIPQFRKYFQKIVELILADKDKIKQFVSRSTFSTFGKSGEKSRKSTFGKSGEKSRKSTFGKSGAKSRQGGSKGKRTRRT